MHVKETPETRNYEQFVAEYNAIAQSAGGWLYEAKQDSAKVQAQYEQSAEMTLREFAETCFQYDQRY